MKVMVAITVMGFFCGSCSREASTPAVIPTQTALTTVLIDIEMGKPVLTIDGWQDYSAGDVVSLQDREGGGRNFEILRGWFVVRDGEPNCLAAKPDAVRMYHVKTR